MKICLAMPSKGHETYIEQAVRSVIAAWPSVGGQLEFRVLHAGADSAAMERVKKMIQPFEGASLTCQSDSGQADALSRCFSETDADVLGWLNSDDLLLPGAAEHVLRNFSEDPTLDVLYGNALFIDQEGTCIGAYPVSDFDGNLLKSFCFISQPSTFFRRETYLDIGGIDTKLQFALDYDLWLRFLRFDARFSRTSVILSATRLHEETKTHMALERFTGEVSAAQERIFPGQVLSARSAWRYYRSRYEKGRVRAIAFLSAMIVGGPPSQLPGRLMWGLDVALLYCRAWLRAKKYVGRVIEP